MSKNSFDFVNVFQGTHGWVVPKDGSLYSRWNMFKGKAGNTSPSAALPFGNVALSPYSGGYSSGYGAHKRNWGLEPEHFFEGARLLGFSHFTHSGSGAFGFYYNYLVTVPHLGGLSEIWKLKEIDGEAASPGYYRCRFTESGICAELTVSDKVAIHRYTQESGKQLKIAVDVSNDGLLQPFDKEVFSYSDESEMKITEYGASGFVVMQGVKLFFAVRCEGKAALWIDHSPIEETEVHLSKTEKRFGLLFDTQSPSVTVKVGFSLVGVDAAERSVSLAPDFDTAKGIAEDEWRKRLSTIELEGISDEDREIFYSNYYHSLIKPLRWQKESFLWDEKETFVHDFATLWDVYKTQMPLLFTLHPDVGRDIVKTLIRYGAEKGKLFNSLMLSANMNIESTQACCLGCYILYDAYMHGLVLEDEIDGAFNTVRAELGQYEKGIKDGSFEKTTKLLDATLIAAAFADIAKALGREEDEKYLSEIAKYWTDAFGDDGLLKDGYPYYEGNRWNYSFRFVRDPKKRIEIGGGSERVIEQLDSFFGITDGTEIGNRFEGFNNETDMETPYFYHYVGRYDRIAKIMDECIGTCFKTGRDGLPGNNDSGGLSACYMWNYLGIFPIIGQDKVMLGIPRAKRAVIHLPSGKDLVITADNPGKLPTKITLNSDEINDFSIPIEALISGGKLAFK